jgi:hypothetical protein
VVWGDVVEATDVPVATEDSGSRSVEAAVKTSLVLGSSISGRPTDMPDADGDPGSAVGSKMRGAVLEEDWYEIESRPVLDVGADIGVALLRVEWKLDNPVGAIVSGWFVQELYDVDVSVICWVKHNTRLREMGWPVRMVSTNVGASSMYNVKELEIEIDVFSCAKTWTLTWTIVSRETKKDYSTHWTEYVSRLHNDIWRYTRLPIPWYELVLFKVMQPSW